MKRTHNSDIDPAEIILQFRHRLLQISNRHNTMSGLLNEAMKELERFTDCAAVAFRILDSEGNIPYEAYWGFSDRFYRLESPLSIKTDNCMCINVIKRETDPSLSFYTEGGSFYTNGTSRFLTTISEEKKGATRNVCNEFGYESVALIPIFLGDRILGLIHVADFQENKVPLELVKALEGVAMQLGTSLERVWTHEALQQAQIELERRVETRIAELRRVNDQLMQEIIGNKQVEEQLKKQKEELSEFAHAMAHDLGSSLTSIHGFAELLEKQHNKSYVKKIRQNAWNMSELLSRSLALADAGLVVEKIDEVDLNQLISVVVKATIPNSITFDSDLLPTVTCDREKVSQIFKNLFENAVIHGNPKRIEVRRTDSGKGIHLLIANDGMSIPPNEEEKIFFRGYTTRKGSSGLGLAIVKKLVEAHKWQISLDSTSDKTTFRIFIPTSE